MKKLIDATVPMKENMMVYPGDPPCTISQHWQIEKGDAVNLSILCFGSHTGTHIDAPRHFISTGKTISELPVEHFIGRAKLFEFPCQAAIELKDVEDLGIGKGDIVLFKTRNSAFTHEQGVP